MQIVSFLFGSLQDRKSQSDHQNSNKNGTTKDRILQPATKGIVKDSNPERKNKPRKNTLGYNDERKPKKLIFGNLEEAYIKQILKAILEEIKEAKHQV